VNPCIKEAHEGRQTEGQQEVQSVAANAWAKHNAVMVWQCRPILPKLSIWRCCKHCTVKEKEVGNDKLSPSTLMNWSCCQGRANNELMTIEKREFENNILATEFPLTHRARQQTYTAISSHINIDNVSAVFFDERKIFFSHNKSA